MPNFDTLFQTDSGREEHPAALFWREIRERPEIVRAELEFRRERDGLSFKPAEFLVTFFDEQGRRIDFRQAAWDLGLHEDLIASGFAARSSANEAERFGFALKSHLEPAELRYGDGFFNSVLVEYVKALGIDKRPEAADVLSIIHENRAYTGGESYGNCQDMVAQALRKVAQDLTSRLSYDRDSAESILAGSVSYYMDERFSVTSRRLLGLK